MKILILNNTEIEHLLPMPECIALMRDALIALARGEAHQPLRMIVRPPGAPGLLGLMPAWRGGAEPAFGLKAIGIFPGNVRLGLDSHQGSVLLLSGETGQLQAVLNASAVTAIRTAAVSGVATDALARPEAATLAVIGAGVQARTHLAAILAVRTLREARIASRTRVHAEALAADVAPLYPFPVRAVENVEAALRGADLVVTATSSAEPVVRREWIEPGCHVNAVGASLRAARELDSATVAAASLFVDRRESAANEAGDYLMPLAEGVIGPDHIRAEIGEVLAGEKPGRASDGEITVFKSLGLAVEDLAAAGHLYQAARTRGVGTWVEF